MQSVIEGLEARTFFSVSAVVVHSTPSVAAKKPAAVSVSANPAIGDPTLHYQTFAGDPLFAPAGPSADDVNQGELGDCYFLASLAAVAKADPSLLEQDITANAGGTYTVKLYSGKTIKAVRVTDTLPVFSDGTLAYAGLGQDDCTWVAIVEKAYAEVRSKVSSYATLDGGWMSDAFNALGIRNASTYAVANTTTLGKTLVADQKAGDATTYATGDAIVGNAPLYSDHAYSIDSFTVNAKGQLLSLTLRNPWGDTEPNDGYVTLTATQAMQNFNGLVVGLV